MGSGKGGGDASKTYDYYATFAGVVRAGKIDTLHSLLIDGKEVWAGPVNRTDGGVTNPYELVIADSKWLREGGYVRVYWGDDDQTTSDAALVDHPPYRGFAYVVLHRFLVGREKTTLPNVELIATAHARPPAGVIASTGLDDGNCNPWAIVADLLTSQHGLALDETILDPASFAEAHDYLAATAGRKLLAYCSPLLTSGIEAKAFCQQILQTALGSMRWSAGGALEAVQLPVDPGTLSLYLQLTENDYEAPVQMSAQSWDSVPTGVVVRYRDRDRWWKETSRIFDDANALRCAVEPKRVQFDAIHVTRASQAMQIGAEAAKRLCTPQRTGSVSIRLREKLIHPAGHAREGEFVRAGDRIRLDIDTEPGGDGLSQLVRVDEIRWKATGPVSVRFTCETNSPAVPFSPTYTPTDPELPSPSNITQAIVIPLPPFFTDGAAAVGVLALRPDDMITGADVEYDSDDGAGTFVKIGEQIGFAVPVTVVTDYDASDLGTIRLNIENTRDQHLALRDVGDSGANNDDLILVIYRLASGQIEVDGDGQPLMEFLSIVSSAAVSGDTYDFTVLRNRQTTLARDWEADDVGWIIPRSSLAIHRHLDFDGRINTGASMTFHLRSFNRFLTYDDTLAEYLSHFPSGFQRAPSITWVTPSASDDTADPGTGEYTPAATIDDPDGNLTRVTVYQRRMDTDELTVIADIPIAAVASISLADVLTAAGVSTPLVFAGEATTDTTYAFTIRAIDATGLLIESSRNIIREATGTSGGNPLPPSFSPASGAGYTGSVDVTITTKGLSTDAWWVILPGSTPPTPQQDPTLVGSHFDGPGSPPVNTAHVSGTGVKRLWARSGYGGTFFSDWVYADYTGS